jgi:hypothetical protein
LEEWLFESAKLLQPHRVLAGFALLLCSMFHHVSAARSEQRAVLSPALVASEYLKLARDDEYQSNRLTLLQGTHASPASRSADFC